VGMRPIVTAQDDLLTVLLFVFVSTTIITRTLERSAFSHQRSAKTSCGGS
jgi:hypothetical protein